MTATLDEKLSIERVRNQLETPGYFSMQPDDLRAVLSLAEKEAGRPPLRNPVAAEQEAVSIIEDAVNEGLDAFERKVEFKGRPFVDRILSLAQESAMKIDPSKPLRVSWRFARYKPNPNYQNDGYTPEMVVDEYVVMVGTVLGWLMGEGNSPYAVIISETELFNVPMDELSVLENMG